MNYADPSRRAALAAEYTLGTLQGAARRRFEQLLTRDAALRAEVERWQNSLYPLIEVLPDRPPPPRVWQAIARRTAPASPPPRVGLWESLRFWHAWGLLAGALALVLALYVALDLLRPGLPDAVAIISDRAEHPAWLVRVDRARQRLSIQVLRPQTLPANRSFELWLLPGEGQAPHSLGLLPASGSTSLGLATDLARRLPTAQGLAVSVEPAGGSPTGQPTGPVLYQGVILPPA